jgi:hypothetical protein
MIPFIQNARKYILFLPVLGIELRPSFVLSALPLRASPAIQARKYKQIWS